MGLDIYWGRIDPKGTETCTLRNDLLALRPNKFSQAALFVKMAKKLGSTKTIRRTYNRWNEAKQDWTDPYRTRVTVVKYRAASDMNTTGTDSWVAGSAVAYEDLRGFYRDPKHQINPPPLDEPHIDWCNIYLTKKADVDKLAVLMPERTESPYYADVAKALVKDFIEGQDFVLLNW